MKQIHTELIIALLLLAAYPVGGGEISTEKTILSTAIGKWENLVIRTGSQQRPDDATPSGLAAACYAVDIDRFTRDRDGQGVYREGVTRLLNCDARDVKMTRGAGGSVELQWHFEQSQGDGKSDLRIDAAELAGSDQVAYAVKFSGSGGVYDGFLARFSEAVSGAEWVESIDKLRWQLHTENLAPGATTNSKAAGSSGIREIKLFANASELDPALYIPNPDASRIAVIIGLVERGYEGAPHPRLILIAGAGVGGKF